MSEHHAGQVDHVLHENRVFPPPPEFTANAVISTQAEYERLYREAAEDPDKFWGKEAEEHLHWFEPFNKVLDWREPFAQWFVGGKTNAAYNCLDAHVQAGRGDRTAIIYEGEPGDTRKLTYKELLREVCRFTDGLKRLGVGQGDVVSIYMPMTPELVIAMLACARLGAVHSVIFAGFSAEAIADRNNDAGAKVQITANGGYRRGKLLPLKDVVDAALAKSPTVQACVVYQRADVPTKMQSGRDHWWHDLVASSPDFVRQRPSIVKTLCSSSIPAVALVSQRGFGTRPRVITSGPNAPSSGSSIIGMMTSTGAPPTVVGSPVTVTLFMVRYRLVPRA